MVGVRIVVRALVEATALSHVEPGAEAVQIAVLQIVVKVVPLHAEVTVAGIVMGAAQDVAVAVLVVPVASVAVLAVTAALTLVVLHAPEPVGMAAQVYVPDAVVAYQHVTMGVLEAAVVQHLAILVGLLVQWNATTAALLAQLYVAHPVEATATVAWDVGVAVLAVLGVVKLVQGDAEVHAVDAVAVARAVEVIAIAVQDAVVLVVPAALAVVTLAEQHARDVLVAQIVLPVTAHAQTVVPVVADAAALVAVDAPGVLLTVQGFVRTRALPPAAQIVTARAKRRRLAQLKLKFKI